MKKKTFTFLFLTLFSASLFAGGYQVRLQGQKQTGIGLIGTPFSFGSSSMFYNPGALSFMKTKYDFSVGISPIFSHATFAESETDYQVNTDNPTGTPFYAYGAGKLTDNLSIGLGVYTPFGSSSKWPDEWAGRFLIQNISLKAIFYQATLAYSFGDKFGIGAGFVFATGDVKLQKALNYNDSSYAKLEGNASNIGYNIGLYYKPNDKLSIGIDYRSKIIMKLENGKATFKVPVSLSTTIPAQNKFSAELPMPANLDFGLAYKFTDKFTLAAEANWVMWSAYKTLDFTFEDKGELLNSTNPREYKDTWLFRLGGEYNLNPKFDLRAGVYYDPTPSNENYYTPETVTLNTIAFTLGVSYKPIEKLSIDLTYLQTNGLQADKSYEPANFSGTYKSIAFIPGIGVSYSF